MPTESSQPAPFTVEWLIAAVVIWVVSAGCALLMGLLKATESRHLQDDALIGAVALMLAQHAMTVIVCGVTVHRNRSNRIVATVAACLGVAAVAQAIFLSSFLTG